MKKDVSLLTKNEVSGGELKKIQKEWRDLKCSFFDAITKNMYTYMDSDLNAMAVFLRKHKKYIPDETFQRVIKLMNSLVKEIWKAAEIGAPLKTQLSIVFTEKKNLPG